MKLKKIDLSQIVAVGHNNGQLGLLIDRGEEIQYIEIPAPEVAYDGLQYMSNFANKTVIPQSNQDLTPLRGSLPSDQWVESCFLRDQQDEEQAAELLIELQYCDEDSHRFTEFQIRCLRITRFPSQYYPVDFPEEELSAQTNPCDQLLNFHVPGYSLGSTNLRR